MKRNVSALLAALWVAATVAGTGLAEDWPNWRGPTGMGHTTHKDLPLTWGGKTNENIRWKVPLYDAAAKVAPDHNQSSPVVRKGRVFITLSYWPAGATKSQYPEHHVVCFRADDGQRLWDTVVPPGPWLLKDIRGGYTAPTPAVDDARVYAIFGSSVLAALDLDGKVAWRKDIKPFLFDVAFGASPVLYGDHVLVMCEQLQKASRLLAFDRKTGALAWEKKRPHADWTHSTPVIATVNGKPQLLVAGATTLEGLNPETGNPLWICKTGKRTGDTVSPVFGNGLVYCDSGRGGSGVAVAAGGSGDVTATHRKWTISQVPDGFSSPIIVGDYLYRVHNPGTLKCWELATGKKVYEERLAGVTTSAARLQRRRADYILPAPVAAMSSRPGQVRVAGGQRTGRQQPGFGGGRGGTHLSERRAQSVLHWQEVRVLPLPLAGLALWLR